MGSRYGVEVLETEEFAYVRGDGDLGVYILERLGVVSAVVQRRVFVLFTLFIVNQSVYLLWDRVRYRKRAGMNVKVLYEMNREARDTIQQSAIS